MEYGISISISSPSDHDPPVVSTLTLTLGEDGATALVESSPLSDSLALDLLAVAVNAVAVLRWMLLEAMVGMTLLEDCELATVAPAAMRPNAVADASIAAINKGRLGPVSRLSECLPTGVALEVIPSTTFAKPLLVLLSLMSLCLPLTCFEDMLSLEERGSRP